MDVTITARHCTVPAPVRERTTRRFGRLDRFHPRAASASVSFEADHGRKRCEAHIHVDGGPPLFASCEDASFRGALDGVVDRLERQLKRQRERRRQFRTDAARA